MTYNGYTNWDTWAAALWASSEYWGYRWVMSLSVEELADYVAEHAQEWDNLDHAEVTYKSFTTPCMRSASPLALNMSEAPILVTRIGASCYTQK